MDWELRRFHGNEYSTHRGSTYNSYLIREKKTVFIDTVWNPFSKEFVKELGDAIDLRKIDAVIAKHAEIDHSGKEKEETMKNVFENIPYQEDSMGKRKLVDEKHLLMMQVALQPGQSVPQHNANANVHLIIVKGELVVNLDGKDTVASEGTLLPVAYNTPMSIENKSQKNATFLIIKTPNPSEMEK